MTQVSFPGLQSLKVIYNDQKQDTRAGRSVATFHESLPHILAKLKGTGTQHRECALFLQWHTKLFFWLGTKSLRSQISLFGLMAHTNSSAIEWKEQPNSLWKESMKVHVIATERELKAPLYILQVSGS